MSTPPKTVLHATDEEAEAIREAVRVADPATLGPRRVKADMSHVPGLVALLADEAVSGPIYDLPRPITADSVTRVRRKPTRFNVSTGFNDMHFFSHHLGIPTLGYGPGGEDYHAVDERARVRDLVDAAKIYADLLTTFAG